MTTTFGQSTSEATEKARRKAEALRELADMIEANPEIRAGYLEEPFSRAIWCPHSGAELAAIARAAKAHGATVNKEIDGDQYNLVVSWHGVKFAALGLRSEVCERVKIGEETVTERIPDPDVEVPTVEVTKTVDQFEWQCTPLLANEENEVP